MSKQKTAVQINIDSVKEQISILEQMQDVAEHAPSCIRILKNTFNLLTATLPIERQQIEQAYIDGKVNAGNDIFGQKYIAASDYYEQTYK
jgi:hypothetical protein